jgi:hypothetical protein
MNYPTTRQGQQYITCVDCTMAKNRLRSIRICDPFVGSVQMKDNAALAGRLEVYFEEESRFDNTAGTELTSRELRQWASVYRYSTLDPNITCKAFGYSRGYSARETVVSRLGLCTEKVCQERVGLTWDVMMACPMINAEKIENVRPGTTFADCVVNGRRLEGQTTLTPPGIGAKRDQARGDSRVILCLNVDAKGVRLSLWSHFIMTSQLSILYLGLAQGSGVQLTCEGVDECGRGIVHILPFFLL